MLRSLRSRILLLALLLCVLLGSALTGFILLLRQTQSAIVSGSQARLLSVVTSFAGYYLSAPALSNTLTEPPGPQTDAVLAALTSRALENDPGVEGGFYSSATGDLLGYAFPTQDGPGPKRDIPPRERPTILLVARQAAADYKPAASIFRGQEDVILFQAVPIARGDQILGSVWAMHRIHDVNSARDLPALLGVSCLGLAAMACVGVAFWITRHVQSDVAAIQTRLHDLEVDLSQPRRGDVSASELHGILTGIDKLGISLQQKIEQERQLIEQLHHKDRLAALGQVAAGVAHELRNPLATIRLRAQMSMRSKDPEQLDRSARLTLEEIDRLSHVLDRLLFIAKPIELQRKIFYPAQLCEDLVASLAAEAESASIEINFIGSQNIEVSADALKLRQVLDNLLRNAMESFAGTTPAPGRKIVVTLAPASDQVRIHIEDNGCGMPDDVAAKVFDPFFTTKARGTGLGLSIAREIVRAHHGSLTLAHQPSGGTRAELILPQRNGQ